MSRQDFKLVAVLCFIMVCAGIYLLYAETHMALSPAAPATEQNPPQPQPIENAQTQPQKENAAKQFETVLNEFLKTMDEKTQSYREQRKILAELVKAENLTEPSYIEENHAMFMKLAPSLRAQMDDIMHVFETTEAKISELLQGQSDLNAQPILQKWQELKQKQAGMYIDFFAIEDQMLLSYEDLMNLYFQNRNDIIISSLTGQMGFKNPEDRDKARALLERLDLLAKKESIILEGQE